MPFGIVNILEITLVSDGFYPLLKGQHLHSNGKSRLHGVSLLEGFQREHVYDY